MLEKLILIGGSAGSITSVTEIIRRLPAHLNAAICVTIHIPSTSESYLPAIFEREAQMKVKHAEDGEMLLAGTVYVARPDLHLLIQGGMIKLARGAKENRHRPAIDPMFRSGARSFGQNVLGILLSGYLDDGAAGLITLAEDGATTIIQDPRDTVYPEMPLNALEYLRPDKVALIEEMPKVILEFCSHTGNHPELNPGVDGESNKVLIETGDHRYSMKGELSGFICPDCKGPLWESFASSKKSPSYRCHEGHSFGALSLAAGQNEALESALWESLRLFDEKIDLNKRLAKKSLDENLMTAFARYSSLIARGTTQAQLIRDILSQGIRPETDK
ncbi:MAG: chemotaxis protein CheB [Proteobacteria bacterium]|nr:MAG: chemotaxis protein CheB [Pseudomonadota bacterium]